MIYLAASTNSSIEIFFYISLIVGLLCFIHFVANIEAKAEKEYKEKNKKNNNDEKR